MMVSLTPVGPYQSLREAICTGLSEGRAVDDIAADLNAAMGRTVADQRIRKYASAIKHRGGRARPVTILLNVPETVFGGLTVRALDRGITPTALANRLIEVAVRDNMIDAILDDGGKA